VPRPFIDLNSAQQQAAANVENGVAGDATCSEILGANMVHVHVFERAMAAKLACVVITLKDCFSRVLPLRTAIKFPPVIAGDHRRPHHLTYPLCTKGTESIIVVPITLTITSVFICLPGYEREVS
jgi:hypothetical protein